MAKNASVPVSEMRDLVIIKGVRNGLLFILSDNVPFQEVLAELQTKVTGNSQGTPTTVAMLAYVEVGARTLEIEEETALRQVFACSSHLLLQGLSESPPGIEHHKEPYVYKGTVRSGKVIEHDGDIVVIGDVNAGGQVIASGDVFVMGHLRGFAHAGAGGDVRAVVAAVYFDPLQVRIADVIRRAPDTASRPADMEFAFLDGDQMGIEKMAALVPYRARLWATQHRYLE